MPSLLLVLLRQGCTDPPLLDTATRAAVAAVGVVAAHDSRALLIMLQACNQYGMYPEPLLTAVAESCTGELWSGMAGARMRLGASSLARTIITP